MNRLTQRLNFYVTDEQYEKVTKDAKEVGMTIGSYIRLLIEATKKDTIINLK